MSKDNFEQHLYEARLECSYLLHVPETIDDSTLMAVTLHGYGMNARDMLRLTLPAVGGSILWQHYKRPINITYPTRRRRSGSL